MAFTKKIEDFTCDHCGYNVKGKGYTNHCPKCLWSKQEALIDRYDEVRIKSDSELLTKQLTGEYKVKNDNLRPYYDLFQHISKGFSKIEVISIGRECNSLADKLANKAIDSRFDSSLKIE